MARTVKVDLEASVAGYVAPVEEAKVATEELDKKVEGLNRDLDKVPAASAKAAASMKLLGGDAGGVGKQFEDTGNKATNALQLVDKRIEDTRANVKKFAEDFNKTGSATSFDLWKSASKDLSGLEKIKKDLSKALEDGGKDGGSKVVKALDWAMKGAESGITSAMSVWWVKAIAIGLPLIASVTGAALLGALGLGVIGAGIAGQIHGAEVQRAFGELKNDASDVFGEATKPFQGVLTRELGAADDLVRKLQPELTQMFSKAAPAADHLFAGLNGFVEQLLPGLNKGLDGAVVIVDELGRDLPMLGRSLGQAFALTAQGARGEADALHDLLAVIDGVVISSGRLMGAEGNLYEAGRQLATGNLKGLHVSMKDVGDVAIGIGTLGIVPLINHLTGLDKKSGDSAAAAAALADQNKEVSVAMQVAAASIDIAGGKAMSASDQYGMLISQLSKVNETSDKVNGAMVNAIMNPMIAADRAANSFDESLITLGDTLVANGGQLSAHVGMLKKSETGALQNKDAVLAVVQANLQEYDSQIAVGVSAQDAAAKYDENTRSLEDQLRAAHYTTAQIDALIGKYRAVPDKVDSSIAINGLTQAIDGLNDLERLINHLPSRTITIQNVVYTNVPPQQLGHGLAQGGMRRAAVGMFIPPSDPGTVLTGEPQTGGEMLTPLRGISQAAAMAQTKVIGDAYGFNVTPRGRFVGGGGGGSFRHEFVFTGGGTDLERVAGDAFMGLVRTGKVQIQTTRN